MLISFKLRASVENKARTRRALLITAYLQQSLPSKQQVPFFTQQSELLLAYSAVPVTNNATTIPKIIFFISLFLI